ncbi:WD40 repeat domain-containing protein [Myxococcota bacterium]|nr:WD40 repeat domain-containing protein [Myxococcota bacterium]
MSRVKMTGPVSLGAQWRLALGDHVAALGRSAHGFVFAGLGDGRLVGVELAGGAVRFDLRAHDAVLGLSISPDELPGGSRAGVDVVAWAPRGGRLATASGRRVRIWSRDGDPIFESDPLPSSAPDLAWRPDGDVLAVACYGGVHLLPMLASGPVRHLAWKGSLISITWSPDTKVVACGSQDCSVHFWRLATGADSEMTGYATKPKALTWDRTSELLATAGGASITLWRFAGPGPEGSRPIVLEGHERPVTQLQFHPAAATLASGDPDGVVCLWHPKKSRRPIARARLDAAITAMTWDQEGRTLVVAGANGTVCAFDAASGGAGHQQRT